jgi:hypothetical protein
MFSNGFYKQGAGLGSKGVGGFIKVALCISVRQTNLPVQPHYPGMGRGLVQS